MKHLGTTTGGVAAATTATPTEIVTVIPVGNYLVTHSPSELIGIDWISFLSWQELFQIIAATWVSMLIIKSLGVFSFIKWAWDSARQ